MEKNLWEVYTEDQLKELESLTGDYKKFLDTGKTERECVTEVIRQAEAAGYIELSKANEVKPGDKVYAAWMGKSIALFNIGEEPVENGMNILGAHIDSPRMDLKQNPLYEESGFAYFDTHYYGGIKKYQWVTIPLAIHGVVVRKDGTTVEVSIGEKDEDPVFVVTDLLIHLSGKQLEKKANTVVEGENLDILIGSRPLAGEEKDAAAAQILKLLKETYDIEKEDLMSAELEVVPAGKARDCGLDRSMIMAYGQDDRVCAYTSLAAMLDVQDVKRTSCCILVDKEEIGSVGATGMHSRFFENAVADLLDKMSVFSELKLRHALANSTMISSDVGAAYDPMYADVYDKKSSSFFGNGLVIKKHTGSRGKSGSNDANAEYIAKLRRVFDKNQVAFQMTEMGKIDVGGGGTIAYILAQFGMEVIDGGVAVLCMHAPWEVSSKADVYEAYRAYCAFLKDMN
ncbi:aminopeptidase [Eubacterium sp. am_0171]|uniref:M18 family aminopeptidase n=1 Tax=Faecalicatena contorta TaxID=39482 RepID=A0A174I667_9FIRM|nr:MULTISPECIES: aminopeptidase [Clostridia]MSC86193.1 aminopeptidase [Eubacterium sp. BIOML-A1]MSD07329.1 aminopeptidase [Eubacterium sp. BIOML-A2]RYT15357.1 aminopeptidase [Eubacterium sp. am_0171]CUO81536.1 Probable M18 family aminopeptidase 1 [[Eubacterium] contortum] [Faecalicatena contorta]